jgi:hypothetical protein
MNGFYFFSERSVASLFSSPARRRGGQLVQVVPLRVNATGVASLAAQLPWKPSVMLLPAAMVAL